MSPRYEGKPIPDSGGGFEGDVVAECFELADVVASFGVGVDVAVVVVGAGVVEAGVGVGEEVPDDHQQGSVDRDDGFVLASSADEASVASTEEGVCPARSGHGLAEDPGEVAVAVPGRPVALGLAGRGGDPWC